MRLPELDVDYRKFRLNKLKSKEFSHLLMVIYWPLFGLAFSAVERSLKVKRYYAVYSPIDDYIPFCEIFLLPYLWWFIFMAGLLIYQLFYDVDAFKRCMKYIMFTYTVTLVIYVLFPNCQQLRPDTFERDNVLTRFMQAYYDYDTNTNVCPSLHVIGSLAIMSGGLYTKTLQKRAWKIYFVVTAVLICISTVFVKQHSVIDIFAALPLCALAHYLFFAKKKINAPKNRKSEIKV